MRLRGRMVARQQVIARWKNGLAEAEAQLAEGSLRFRWLRRIYVRLYRFLLVSYGDRDWRDQTVESSQAQPQHASASRMPFVDHTAEQSGLDPKSPARIRAALKSVHKANVPQQRRGSLQGLQIREWVTLTSTHRANRLAQFQKRLMQHNIDSRIVYRTTDYALEVRHKEFDEAYRLICRLQNEPNLDESDADESVIIMSGRAHWLPMGVLLLLICGAFFGPLIAYEIIHVQATLVPYYFFLWLLSSWIGWCVGTQRVERSQ